MAKAKKAQPTNAELIQYGNANRAFIVSEITAARVNVIDTSPFDTVLKAIEVGDFPKAVDLAFCAKPEAFRYFYASFVADVLAGRKTATELSKRIRQFGFE